MIKPILPGLLYSLIVMHIVGCSFGGFNETASSTPASGQSGSSSSDTILSGVVAKGLFLSGTVRIYQLNNAGKEALLRTKQIGPFGNYSASIGAHTTATDGSYSGIFLIKASGSYIDEATDVETVIDDSAPLRAIIANPSGEYTAAVTPLTELATRKALAGQLAGNQLFATDVREANRLLSELFKVDIIATKPVRADYSSAGFGNAATTQAQKDYTLALAAISQMAKDTGGLTPTLTMLGNDLADGTMSVESATAFQTALATFLASDKNITGVTASNATNLINVGGLTKMLRLATTEKAGNGILISGITVTVQLPRGVTVRADLSSPDILEKEPLNGMVFSSGPGALAGTLTRASYIPATDLTGGLVTVGLINTSGFTAGEFATIRCDMPAGSSLQTSDFSIYRNLINPNDSKNFRAVDGNGEMFPDDHVSVEILPE